MKQEKWFDRTFDYKHAQQKLPLTLERLAQGPSRLAEKVREVPEAALTVAEPGKWSIKEHIGHLTDLEPLWLGRLDDIINGEIELRTTDLTNSKTHLANHNAKPLSELLTEFSTIRQQTMIRLKAVNGDVFSRSALHPRLRTPMRVADLFLFVAEHGDHHITSITLLLHPENE